MGLNNRSLEVVNRGRCQALLDEASESRSPALTALDLLDNISLEKTGRLWRHPELMDAAGEPIFGKAVWFDPLSELQKVLMQVP